MMEIANNLNEFVYEVENEKFLFLYNDLSAAQWVYNIKANLSDQRLVDSFMDIHDIFLGRLNRKDKGFFRKLPIAKLAEIVRGWILLYKRTLDLLREEFPRTAMSRDLVIGSVNWSKRLKLSSVGLLFIDHSSRYAEFWAERSIKTKEGYNSLETRLSFIGNCAYKDYAQMVRKGELLILDSFSNGVTSYDMMLFIRKNEISRDSFFSEIEKLGWRLEVGNKKAIDNIFRIYEQLDELKVLFI